jgi:dihydrofolate reductase
MRKLVSHLLTTLDGTAIFDTAVIQAIMKLRDKEVQADFFKHVADEDAMLLGRVTYSEWSDFWPTSTIEPFASHINSVPKYVASNTLSSAPWGTRADAHLLLGTIEAEVAKLKRLSGKNIGIHGSPTLVESLLQSNLIDELRLEVYPIVAGTGAPFFRPGRKIKQLELVGSLVTRNGVVILTYRPVAASSPV